jgi:hypothetical protein
MSKTLQALVVFVCVAGSLCAQERAEAAVPGLATIPLFAISWNLTSNYVQYDAVLKDGKVDPKEPVKAYWIMKQTDGHREDLTLIERLKGYGFSIRPGRAPDTFDMVVVSVKKKTLHVARNGEHFEVTLSIGGCASARLMQAHVQAHRWGPLPVGEFVDLTGTDVKTGEECHERVMRE